MREFNGVIFASVSGSCSFHLSTSIMAHVAPLDSPLGKSTSMTRIVSSEVVVSIDYSLSPRIRVVIVKVAMKYAQYMIATLTAFIGIDDAIRCTHAIQVP